jgi:dienelactone hydrolase
VEIESDGWKIIGDLVVPEAKGPVPAVLMFNGAARDRTPYRELAEQLARLGIASLRVDLRGHGESINRGKFVPGQNLEILENGDRDVAAAFAFLKADRRVDSARIGMVGASYSGEDVMIAGRKAGYAAAYVALSPGSLSDESIAAIDQHKLPYLLVVARHERHLKEVVQALREQSRTAEFLELSGTEHATRLLPAHPDLAERIAVWFRYKLNAR